MPDHSEHRGGDEFAGRDGGDGLWHSGDRVWFGALPEIVDHGRTGFIVSNVEEMGEALRSVESIQPETCRRVARSRFSARTMEARYLALYDRLIGKEVWQRSAAVERPLREWAAAF